MKAIIPAAGFGTRFLPATKSAPKEMLPLVNKPAIQYVVEEAVESGIEDILVITRDRKRSIPNHFDRSIELEDYLRRKGKHDLLQEVQEIGDLADIHYVRQKEPRGLGHAIYQARKYVGNEPFVVLLGDDVVFSKTPCTRQVLDVFEETGGHVVAVERIPPERASDYGVPELGEAVGPRVHRARDLVEKPAPQEAPSEYGVLGRYVLGPSVFDALAEASPGKGGEVQLTDALRTVGKREPLFTYRIEGRRFDLGNPLDWLKTNLEVALTHDELGPQMEAFLLDLLVRHQREHAVQSHTGLERITNGDPTPEAIRELLAGGEGR